jgi:anaerobic dimethyl sulfoxide reductase subunit B (iron-sulfur subunit)
MNQYGFFVNTDKCVACRSCVLACKEKHDLKLGRKFRRLYSCSAGGWDIVNLDNNYKAYNPDKVFSYSLSIGCNHCANPACKNICPAGAIGKRADGIVFIDRDLCTGCGSCAAACPYGVPSLNEVTQKMEKCDFCRELLSIGEPPACVAACSMNALEYGDLDILKLKYPQAVPQMAPLEGPEKTEPSLLIMQHRKYNDGMEVLVTSLPEEIQANANL